MQVIDGGLRRERDLVYSLPIVTVACTFANSNGGRQHMQAFQVFLIPLSFRS